MAGACRCGRDCIPGVVPDIVPRVAALRKGTVRLLPTPRHACARSPYHKQPSVSVVPSLPHRGDRPAAASARISSRREHRKTLPTSERRIEVLLPNLQRCALVRPQYEGACPTCSAWRSDSLRRPRMLMPQWCHRLLNRRLAHRSPQKVLAGKTRRKHNRGYSRWNTRDFASSTAEMPLPLGIGNASAWECPSPHDGSFRTECLPLLYGRPLRYSLVIVTAYSKNKATSCFAMNVGCDSR
ncbi:trans-sialidase [Trypanosoma cruzi]|nr:trans-sialidase [Trypanosoma cruzi]